MAFKSRAAAKRYNDRMDKIFKEATNTRFNKSSRRPEKKKPKKKQ